MSFQTVDHDPRVGCETYFTARLARLRNKQKNTKNKQTTKVKYIRTKEISTE